MSSRSGRIASVVLLIAAGAFAAPASRPSAAAQPARFTERTLGPAPLVAAATQPAVTRDGRHVVWVARVDPEPGVGGEPPAFRLYSDGVAGTACAMVTPPVLSPDGRRHMYAAQAERGGRWRAVVDGKEGPEFDSILDSLMWSPDGRRHAYVARHGGAQVVVIDHRAGPPVREVRRGSLAFDPGSKRVAYVAGGLDGRDRFYLDQEPGPPHEQFVAMGAFSPDGARTVYVSRDGRTWRAHVDGQPGPAFDGLFRTPMFSPDGRRVAYAGERDGKVVAVVDGAEWRPADKVGGFLFSPDGARLLAATRTNFEWTIHLDGRTFGPYDGVLTDRVAFGPDGKRVAWVASREAGFAAYVDGEPGPVFGAVGVPTFSPDGKRFWYVGGTDKPTAVVVDGVVARHDRIIEPAVVWTPDGRGYAYAAGEGRSEFLVIDGVRGPPHERIGSGGWLPSPDASRWAYAAMDGGRSRVYLDGKPGPAFAGIGVIRGAPRMRFSPDGGRFGYRAELGEGRWVVVVDGEAGPAYGLVTMFSFSPDGRHVAYMAQADGKWRLVVDGAAGPAVDEWVRSKRGPAREPAEEPVWGPDGAVEVLGERDGKLVRVRAEVGGK